MKSTRRNVLKELTAGLALRSLATGLPASVLLQPHKGFASTTTIPSQAARILILMTSQQGDPLNANVPRTYGPGAEEVAHTPNPALAPRTIRLQGRDYTVAKPWADMGARHIDRSLFFHHATYTPVHQDQSEVMRIMGAAANKDMLVSIIAR